MKPRTDGVSLPRGARRLRRVLVGLGLILLLAFAAILILPRTSLLAWIVLPRLSSALGCVAKASRVDFSTTGTITFHNLRLSAPGIEGPAAVFVEVPSLEVKGDWSTLVTGLPHLNQVTLRQPVVRLSQDENFGLNIAGLRGPGAPAGMTDLPDIEIEDGRIELGEHGLPGEKAWYTPLKSVRVTGKVRRTAQGASTYRVTLDELPLSRTGSPTPPAAGLNLKGEFDLRDLSASIRLGNVSLDRWRDTSVPSPLRDLWSQMRLSGQVQDAEFINDPKSGPSARMRLVAVDLNIPVPADEDPSELKARASSAASDPGATGRTELLRMRRVSGEITFNAVGVSARLNGWIEDLECQVDLSTRGYDPERCGLTCRIGADRFIVGENPRLLPFAPRVMKENFVRFSGPKAAVKGTVDLKRADPTAGAPAALLTVNGYLEFRDGDAEFDRFRYPFTNMQGTVLFDDDKVELARITGVGLSGARLLAQATISPLTVDAGVDVRVAVTDVPLDDHLRRAVPAGRRQILDALFSHEALQVLTDQGLVIDPARARDLQDELEGLKMQLSRASAAGSTAGEDERQDLRRQIEGLSLRAQVPEFALGGTTEIQVHVTREPGPDSEYITKIEARVPQAGILPDAFPYPVVADMLTITMTDEEARAEAPELVGLTGARGSLSAKVTLGQAGAPDVFRIRATAVEAPVDGFLIAALPARAGGAAATALEPEPGSDEQEWSPRRLVKDLGLIGTVSCEADVFSLDDDDTGYDVKVRFAEMGASPGGDAPLLQSLAGELHVSHDGLALNDLVGTIAGAAFHADLSSLKFGERRSPPTSLSGRVDVRGLDLEAPVERLVAALSPSQSRRIETLRADHRPAGRVDATLLMSTRADTTSYLIEFSEARDVSFDVPGGRIGLVHTAGRVSATPTRLIFDDVCTAVACDDEPGGELKLDGSWPIGPGQAGVLDLVLTDGRFEMPLMRALARRISPAISAWAQQHELRGRFGAEGRARAGGSSGSAFTGAIQPRSARFTSAGTAVVLEEISGTITAEETGGRVDGLRVRAPAWSAGADGTWTREVSAGDAAPTISADVSLWLESTGLPPDLMAVLPTDVRSVKDELALTLDGQFSMREGRLRLSRFAGSSAGEAHFDASASFAGASIVTIVPISGASGRAHISARQYARHPKTSVTVDIEADSLQTVGVPMTDARVSFRSSDETGVWVIPIVSASALDGSVVASGVVKSGDAPVGGSAPVARAYEASLRASGIDFAALLASLRTAQPDSRSPGSEPPAVPGSRGVLDAELALAGTMGPNPQRRGRGVVKVKGGEVMALPGMVSLLELSNLQLPTRETLDWASASFFVEKDLVTFDSVEVSSDSLIIAGKGTMDWPSTALDMRFNTRGTRNIPILGELLRGLRNELITTVVSGTLREPDYRLEQLPATRRMLGTIFRGRPRTPTTVSSATEDSPKESE